MGAEWLRHLAHLVRPAPLVSIAMMSRDVLGKATFGWPLVGGVAGAIVLAMVGAPYSPSMLFVVGPDSLADAGAQVGYALCGAGAMVFAVVFDRYWRWLLAAGVAGLAIATAVHAPKYIGIMARVVGSEQAAAQGIPFAVGCLVSAAAGVLVIALFAVARQVAGTAGAVLGGVVAVAGYYGVALIGPLLSADATPRVVLVAVAAVVAVLASSRCEALPFETSGRIRIAAAAAAVATVLPTVLVAVTGKQGFATVVGGVVGLVVLGVAIVAAVTAGATPAVLAAGLVLAAPVVLLVVIHDAPAAGGRAWLIALAGALVGAVAGLRSWAAAVLVALLTLPMVWLASGAGDNDRDTAEFVVWVFLFLAIAAVAASGGLAFRVVRTPAFGVLAMASAVGVFDALNLWRAAVSSGQGVSAAISPTAHWVSAALLVVAVPLLLVLGRERRENADKDLLSVNNDMQS